MRHKAHTNINASKILKQNNLYDSCASRAYYAAYLAGWYWMSEHGQQPPQDIRGNRFWPHFDFPQMLFDWGALQDQEEIEDLEYLRIRRVQADYYPDLVSEEEAEEVLTIAAKLVDQLSEYVL